MVSPEDVTELAGLDTTASTTLEEIRAASLEHDGHDPLDEAARLRLKNHGLRDTRLWVAATSGFAVLHGGALDLAVHPDRRGQGVGTALAAAVASDTSSAWSHGDDPAAAHLAAHHGFVRSRELWVMRRRSELPLPEVVLAPQVRIRAFAAGDEAEVLRINAAAFAHHPEQGAMDAENLAERMAEPWFDPDGLLIAVDQDAMVGFHWTKRHSSTLGEVYVVAVAPEAQGRGLGRILTLAGLHHLADVEEVLLYVESDNGPARSVYEGLGFTHADRDTHVQYRRG